MNININMSTSLISSLREFIGKLESDEVDERKCEDNQIQQLETFVKDYKKANVSVKLSEQEITRRAHEIYDWQYDKGFRNPKLYDLDFMSSLESEIVDKLIEFDKKEFNNRCRLIYYACCHIKDNKYIIWLIERGFSIDDLQTAFFLCENGNLELLKYLHQRYNIMQFPTALVIPAIKNGHLHLLKWFSEELNFPTVEQNTIIINISLISNHIHILEYLLKERRFTYTDDCVKYNEKFIRCGHIKNSTLMWLYANEYYKWNKEEAERLNNPFMLSVFE